MKRRTSVRPCLELLEDRSCPSVSVGFSNGILVVKDNQSANLAVTEVKAGVFTVSDQGSLVGTYIVPAGISVQLTGPNSTVGVDLDGHKTPGDISVNLGTGTNQLDVHGGTIQGNLTAKGGPGADSVVLGGAAPLRVTQDTFVQLNDGVGDSLQMNGNVTLQGNLTVTSANQVTLAAGSSVGGSAIITGGPAGNQAEVDGTVGGLVRFSGSAQHSDDLAIGHKATLGALSIVLGDGDSTVSMDGTVLGKFYLQNGMGNDSIDLDGNIGLLATLNLGGGNNTVNICDTIGSGGSAVALQFTRGAGNYGADGSDTVNLQVNAFINGSVDMHLGDRGDTVKLNGTIGAVGSGATLNLDTGAGADSVVFANSFVLNGSAMVCLGAGDDTVQLTNGAQFQSAVIDAGTGNDTFIGDASRVTTHGFEVYANPNLVQS
jgi:hypothetical protein